MIIEYKRGTDAGVINQGLFYLSWLIDHRDAFRYLVRDRLGVQAASQVLWGAPRLICVAGDLTRYDIQADRERRHTIGLVRYRFFGSEHVGLEAVASLVQRAAASGSMAELAAAVDETLLGLGEDLTKVENQTYAAYRRMLNYAASSRRRRPICWST